jgi:hypothetical protein
MQKLIKIRTMMDNSKVAINNMVGFILKALEDDYQTKSFDDDSAVDSDMLDDAKKILGDKFKDEDIISILNTANNDIERIKKAKGILDGKKRVKNAVGFMISAIQKDYEENTIVHSGNKFLNFEQKETDYDGIAKQKVLDRMKGDSNG